MSSARVRGTKIVQQKKEKQKKSRYKYDRVCGCYV
jgi:hypothetical protein